MNKSKFVKQLWQRLFLFKSLVSMPSLRLKTKRSLKPQDYFHHRPYATKSWTSLPTVLHIKQNCMGKIFFLFLISRKDKRNFSDFLSLVNIFPGMNEWCWLVVRACVCVCVNGGMVKGGEWNNHFFYCQWCRCQGNMFVNLSDFFFVTLRGATIVISCFLLKKKKKESCAISFGLLDMWCMSTGLEPRLVNVGYRFTHTVARVFKCLSVCLSVCTHTHQHMQ